MSELKNSFHTELAIGILLNDEPELSGKLDLLTAIGLAASNKETFGLCEKFRNRLCDSERKDQRKDALPPIHKQRPRRDSGNEKSNELHGEE